MEELIQIRRQAIHLEIGAIALRKTIEAVQDDGRDITDSHYCELMFIEIESISSELRRLNPFRS